MKKINDELFHLVDLGSKKFNIAISLNIAMLRKFQALCLHDNDLSIAITKDIGSLKSLGKYDSNHTTMFANVFHSLTFSCKITYEWKIIISMVLYHLISVITSRY